MFRPETGKHLYELAQILLRGESPLTEAERELIAAAFCMYNRYVDGLATWAPQDRQYYVNRAPVRAEEGYLDYNLYDTGIPK